jgi:hypothetical protein
MSGDSGVVRPILAQISDRNGANRTVRRTWTTGSSWRNMESSS